MTKVLIIGGGAAGMMAAIAAAEAGAEVVVAERNEKLGKKIYITGKGRCNLTNDCDRDAFFASLPRNPKFMFSAYSRMSPQMLMKKMEEMGLPLVVERGNRVFPVSQKASDVTKTLARRMDALGVEVRLNTRIAALTVSDGRVIGAVTEEGRMLEADRVIVATGGLSYPSTGSTGDGYRFAEEAGLKVTDRMPSLISLEASDPWIPALQGLSLKNVKITARRGKKVLYTDLGEMMFTHYGITGPLVLTLSALLPQALDGVEVTVDLKPGLTPEQLDRRVKRDFETYSSRALAGAMTDLFPQRLISAVIEAADLDEAMSIHHLTRAEWERLLGAVKAFPVHLSGRRGFEEAVVTRGGVDTREIVPATMESKKVSGLYFAGEVLDVDGFTGGFNLQIAFSTGYTAGLAAVGAEDGKEGYEEWMN